MPNSKYVFLVLLLVAATPADQLAQRVGKPRIPPLEPAEWTETHRDVLGTRQKAAENNNNFKTCLREPDLCRNWLPFLSYVETQTPLPPRDKELLILRTSWLARNAYTWSGHAGGAERAGLTKEEIQRITQGPRASGWTAFDAALLRAADELHEEQFITDETWKVLSERYDNRQLMDAVFLVGAYTINAMHINSAGVALQPGMTGLPK